MQAQGARALYDRGLVPVERSGWTLPLGVHAPWPELTADSDADVLVIGAGLAGASLALHLAEAGVGVTVLEARQPGWGASGRNAGHVVPTLRDPSVFERFPDRGERFLEAFRAHRALPFDLARTHSIACDAQQSGYLTVGEEREAVDGVRAQTRWMEARGLLQAAELGGAEVRQATGSARYGAGLVYPEGGRINPIASQTA